LTKRERSIDHETKVAKKYGGIRSKTSGAHIKDHFDVRCPYDLIECKTTGEPGNEKTSRIVKLLEAQIDSAYEVGCRGSLNLRYFQPRSPNSDPDGYIYITVRLTKDDVELINNQCPKPDCGDSCSCKN
jgi:hypothetical protein